MGAGRRGDVLVLATCLAVYGNGVSLALAQAGPAQGWLGVGLGALPAAAMFVWGRRMAALSMRDLGLSRRGVVRSAWIGLLVALAVAVPAVLFLPPGGQ